MKLIKQFRIIALLEGISFLLLIGLAMPIKYFMEMGMPNKVIGMIHGVLFIAYIFYLFAIKVDRNWQMKELALGFISSILPFGSFWFDYKYLKPALLTTESE